MTPEEIMIAEQLLVQGLAYWTEFQKRKAAGTLTMDDVNAAMTVLDTDIDALRASIVAQAG